MYRFTKLGIRGMGTAVFLLGMVFMSFLPVNYNDSNEPGSYAFYKLRYRVEQPVVRPDLEDEMLRMVNKERQRRGLRTLVLDPEMTEVARQHSRDMFARGYFSHYTPEKVSPFDRMKAANITYIKAGENLSMAPTLNMSFNGLMGSSGHRENILRPVFGRLGIGILDGGRYGLMVAQEFRN